MKFAPLTLFSILLLISMKGATQQLAQNYHIKSASTAYHRIANDGSGNVFVFGTFDDVGGKNLGRLVKLDASGNPVTSFQKIYADGVISDLVVQPDQKILISGSFTKVNGQSVPPILRLNTDGSIDQTFSCPLLKSGDLELQTTGKIIVLTDGVFERLNPNGSIDQSFNFQNFVYTFAEYEVAPDNSIFFSSHSTVHKLTPDGADDNSFQIGAGADQGYISALEVQSDGKVLVGGYFLKYNGVESKSIIRLNTNGLVDNSFTAGNNIEGQLFQIIQRSNGKILIGGQFNQYAGQYASLVELNADGTFFKNIAAVSINNITTILEGPDTKIAIAGEFNSVNGISVFGTCRFNSNYTMDLAFSPKVTYNNSNGLRLLVDNAMNATLLGDYQMYGIYSDSKLVKGKVLRANRLGAHDKTFAPNFYNATVYAGHVQDDGKVIVSGGFGNASWEILRLNQDGSKDPSFSIGSGPTTNGTSTAVFAIKKIGDLFFIGGSFTHFNGTPSNSLVAVDVNGTVVKTFSALPALSQVNNIVAQSDGKIIVTGYFSFPTETGQRYIARLKADGSLDDTFHRPTMLQPSSDIAIDQDDNIYLSGDALRPDGSLLESLIKLDKDGFVDGSFSIGSGFAPWAYLTSMELLPDGRIAVGGHFDTAQGIEQPGFAILNPNGTLVPQQATFFGKGSVATDMYFRKGQLFLAGKFKTRDYTEAYAFVKVLFENVTPPAAPTNLSVSLTSPGVLSVGWTANSPESLGTVVERAVDNLSTFVIVDTVFDNSNQYADHISRNHFHAYRVRAINDAGYSAYSNVDSLKWAPAPQGALTLSVPTPTTAQAVLSWQGTILYHDGFIVEYSAGNSSTYTALDTVPVTASTFTHAIVRNLEYRYRVKAYNEFGTLTSLVVSVKWLPLPQGDLLLAITNPQPGKAKLTWTGNILYHDGFSIERSLNPNSGFIAIDSVASTANSFEDIINETKSHYYRVVAYNANGTIVSNKVSILVTGIEDSFENASAVFPNPAKDYVVVAINEQTSAASFSIVDRDGRVLSHKNNLSTGSHAVDISGFTNGIYLVRLRVNGKNLITRIVKE